MFNNASNTPINASSGTVPNVNSALLNWFQSMTFETIAKNISGFQAAETGTKVSFMGVWQSLSGKQLLLKPEGQRGWSWWWLHADPSLHLEVDEIVIYLGKQYRVMSQKDYSLYGYMEYTLIDDWTGSDPKAAI